MLRYINILGILGELFISDGAVTTQFYIQKYSITTSNLTGFKNLLGL